MALACFIRYMPDLPPLDTPPASGGQAPDWDALARYLAGEATEAEKAEIRARLAEHPRDGELIASLDRTLANAALPQDNVDVEAALRRVTARRMDETILSIDAAPIRTPRAVGESARKRTAPRLTSQPVPRWRVPYPALAAAGLLVIGLSSWLALRGRDRSTLASSSPAEYSTRVGERDSLRLADGTLVVLGPQSSLKVADQYGKQQRTVEMLGEAYFDVVHDDARPFVVRTGGAAIRDVGTRFVVRNDGTEGVSVAVTEGSVALAASADSPGGEVVLQAGDHGRVRPGGKTTTRRGGAGADDLAWMQGNLVFREAPLAEVIASLQRWYGIQLRVADPSLQSRHITATFTGEPRERVLEVIGLALGADIEHRGDTAIVRSMKGRSPTR